MIWKKVQQHLLVPAMEYFNSKILEELRACCINSLRLQHLQIIWKNLYISLIFWLNVFIIYERKMVSTTIDYLLNLKINNYIFYLFNIFILYIYIKKQVGELRPQRLCNNYNSNYIINKKFYEINKQYIIFN